MNSAYLWAVLSAQAVGSTSPRVPGEFLGPNGSASAALVCGGSVSRVQVEIAVKV